VPLWNCQYRLVSSIAVARNWNGLTAGAGRGVVEALQKGRARVDGVAASHDGRASLHGGVAVGLIKTSTVVFITMRFRHCGKLPRLQGKVTCDRIYGKEPSV